ncbi:hypothetical protein BVC93_16540 [Mycobacterium sp. MS1601]|uniref:IclR family transcriptional regulator n=1 Tax=Mycobacterium sp. MS1601 TaxID=1936029 RepID=UPI0009795FF2|nr:IclR family transcriptional regulator [Mycobacterium sp. MS1601]AQA03767.1 hypothetical protein BVC93_16540 [Mycobacterium sp. MS1601]
MDDDVPSSLIQSVVRAASILDLFTREPGEWTEQEIVRMTGLNRGTVYRFCQSLVHVGYLEVLPSGKYRPGSKMVAFGQIALRGLVLAEIAEPVLRRTREALGTTINMSVLRGTDIQYILRLRGPSLLDIRLTVGSTLPAYCSSQGRAILSRLPDAEVDAVLAASDVVARTAKGATSTAEVWERIRQARQLGYAVIDEEVDEGMRGVAVPVLGPDGRPAAAINAAYVRVIERGEIEDVIAPQLQQAANEIECLIQAQQNSL